MRLRAFTDLPDSSPLRCLDTATDENVQTAHETVAEYCARSPCWETFVWVSVFAREGAFSRVICVLYVDLASEVFTYHIKCRVIGWIGEADKVLQCYMYVHLAWD